MFGISLRLLHQSANHFNALGLSRACRTLKWVGVICLLALVVNPGMLLAQDFPAKPVRLVVNFPAGGPSEAIARPVAQRAAEIWGYQVLVDFRGGAAGNIGADHVAKSVPDGYTLLMISGSFLTNPALTSNLPFDPIKDFSPITPVASSSLVLIANPTLPVRSVKELILLAKKNSGKLTFASSGNGGSLHLSAEYFKMMTQINMLHIPYKGAGPAMIEVLGGQVDMMFIALPPTLPHIKSGRLRAIGLGGGQRTAILPDLPTIAEQGVKGYEVYSHFGLLGPGGMPRDLVTRINATIVQALQSPVVKERYLAIGSEAAASSADQYATYIKNEMAKWLMVVKKAGVKAD